VYTGAAIPLICASIALSYLLHIADRTLNGICLNTAKKIWKTPFLLMFDDIDFFVDKLPPGQNRSIASNTMLPISLNAREKKEEIWVFLCCTSLYRPSL
jgi:hypothetical protein